MGNPELDFVVSIAGPAATCLAVMALFLGLHWAYGAWMRRRVRVVARREHDVRPTKAA